jgi:hypothetical protein
MPRILIPVLIALVALAALVLFFACNGDDEENGNGETSPSASAGTRTPADETPNGTDAPDGGDGVDKTTPPETPNGETPGATDVVNRTPAPGGIPAVAPADQTAFLSQFADQTINYQNCAYNPSTLLTDCADLGQFSLDPPPVGQADCAIGIVESTSEMIRCTTEEPRQTIYYDIQG